MDTGHEVVRFAVNRRTFLAAGGLGFCGLSLSNLVHAQAPRSGGKAKSTILIWLTAGA